jgi:hypothetical protein
MSTSITEQAKTLWKELQQHANKHYEEDGWDIIAECWSATEVQKILDEEPVQNLEDLIKIAARICGIVDERRREVQSFIF